MPMTKIQIASTRLKAVILIASLAKGQSNVLNIGWY